MIAAFPFPLRYKNVCAAHLAPEMLSSVWQLDISVSFFITFNTMSSSVMIFLTQKHLNKSEKMLRSCCMLPCDILNSIWMQGVWCSSHLQTLQSILLIQPLCSTLQIWIKCKLRVNTTYNMYARIGDWYKRNILLFLMRRKVTVGKVSGLTEDLIWEGVWE